MSLDERNVRIEKLNQIVASGINPYPAKFDKKVSLQKAFESKEGTKVKTAGRLMTMRDMGKLCFCHLMDESQKMQIALQVDKIGKDTYDWFVKNFDIGDFVGVEGEIFKTHKGEISILVSKYVLLCKALRPLPEKWHGLQDLEIRLRERYLDLIMNQEVRELFKLKTRFIQEFKKFMDKNDFLEVATPILEEIPGGAEAEPFITHHNALDINLYLRISLELHLKRLIVGGFEKVYEIGRVFRNEGMSPQHLQEFDDFEFYWSYADWNDLMKFLEKMYKTVIKNTFGTLEFDYQGAKVDFGGAWPKVNYVEIFKEKTGVDLDKADYSQDLLEFLNTNDKDLAAEMKALMQKGIHNFGRIIDGTYKRFIRKNIIQPTILFNHPVAVSPLAKIDPKHPKRTERFQILVLGAEVGNAFSELNDPLDQRRRFEEQVKMREAGDKEAQMLDDDFIRALEHGMPPTGGYGGGIDRLFMYLTNQPSIRNVVFFPTMKPEK
ncbi:MAG: lysine--tRNA ligase [Candidatus Parcubacteria bacterium]|nr:lysine--tRNA ligase [Candidatus Parcubacteria bacterium]